MHLDLWVTDHCNMDCSYCYINKNDKSEFTNGMQKTLIDFIEYQIETNEYYKKENEARKKLAIRFFGGEPLLKFDYIKDLVNKINKLADKYKFNNPVSFQMTTNGTLLDKDKVDYLKENNFSLSLSIDGSSTIQNTHRKLNSGENSWELIEPNLDYIINRIPNTFARSTYTVDTVSELSKGIEFLISKGFKRIKPIPDFFDSRWGEESFAKLEQQLWYITNKHINKEYPKDVKILPLYEYKVLKKYGDRCLGGYSHFSITSNGDIYPCNYISKDEKFCLGNISNLDSIKTPEEIKEECNPICSECAYSECCKSKMCVYINYKMTNKFNKPNGFYCAYQKLMIEIGNKLKSKAI
ncbi:radical SAM protein [Dethiothermospora halolimnae]|uniref:radical SAM protein n=1 Tax=Dethiothermospora halolimnae TaxID=3114390 RepID=UPI003CCC054C